MANRLLCSRTSSKTMAKYEAVEDRNVDDDGEFPELNSVKVDSGLEMNGLSGVHVDSGAESGNAPVRSAALGAEVVPSNIRRAQHLIYASHFVSQFSECAWQFAVVLFLAGVSDYHSILLVSSYSLAAYIAVMLFGSSLGGFLDRSNRLQSARLCIGIENASVLLATIACCWLLTKAQVGDDDGNEDPKTVIPHDMLSVLLIVSVHIFGSLAMLFNQAFVVAIERDWIVVLSQQTSEPEVWLSRTNVLLRQIYLTCKVVSPTFAGWVVGSASSEDEHQQFCWLHAAAVFVGVLCIMSLCVEFICSREVYHLVPALQESVHDRMNHLSDILQEENDETSRAKDILTKSRPIDVNSDTPTMKCTKNDATYRSVDAKEEETSSRNAIALYWEQPVVWAGLSYAFLNSNVMCFGGAMTTYLLSGGMPVEQVGLWRGLSSAVGLAGTFAYKFSANRTTVVNTGAWSIVYLFSLLTVACLSFLVDSTILLVISAAISRIGLWVFDISYTLLYQENVPDGIRGLVGGTQQSLNSLFTILAGCLGIFFSHPDEFWILATAGYGCIAVSMLLYVFGIFLPSTKRSAAATCSFT